MRWRHAATCLWLGSAIGCGTVLSLDDYRDAETTGATTITTATTATNGSASAAGGNGATTGGGSMGGGGAQASTGGGGSGGVGPLGDFQNIGLVAGISTGASDDDDPTFNHDVTELFFNSNRGGAYDIWRSTRANAAASWGMPVRQDVLSSSVDENCPVLTPDGLTLYFAREDAPGNYEIYRATRSGPGGVWMGVTVQGSLNSPQHDVPSAVSEDGLTLLLSSRRSGALRLYMAKRDTVAEPWGTPAVVTELNSPSNAVEGWLHPNTLTAYVSRAGNMSGIYSSTRADETSAFSTPAPVTELNAAVKQSDPWLTADQRFIMFVRGDTGSRQIYQASR